MDAGKLTSAIHPVSQQVADYKQQPYSSPCYLLIAHYLILQAYYGGRDDVARHRNIVWSNGALDPWSGQGVYPPGGGPDGPMVQNVSADGSQISLVLDLGAHHLDLMRPRSLNGSADLAVPPRTALASYGLLWPPGAGGCASFGAWPPSALGTRCGRETQPTLILRRSTRRFTDPRNPPCFAAARAIEEQRITQWIQEAYDAHRGDT